MKKNFKLVLALALALMMVLGSVALATDAAPTADNKTTFELAMPDADHVYSIYQIFTGDISEGVLSNVKWGANGSTKTGAVPDSTLKALEALAKDSSLTDIEKAEAIKDYADLTSTAFKTVSKSTTPVVVPAGYYLINDASDTLAEGDEHTLYIVSVVGPTTITRKANTTTSTKDVAEVNDSTATLDLSNLQNLAYGDYADYDIDDKVPFKLTATITQKYDYYKIYHLTFHDNQCDGLSFNADSVKVYVGSTLLENPTTGDPYYTVVTTGLTAPETFQVVFPDLKKISSVGAGSVISVYYTSTLTGDNVVYGNPGNPNTSHVEYSNNPNDDQGGEETGITPDDTAIVFTYKMDVDKIAANAAGTAYEAKSGAGFTLYKKLNTAPTGADLTAHPACTETGYTSYYAVGAEVKNVTNFPFNGLDAGDYVLVETTTPDGYNTMAPLSFTITRTIAANGSGVYQITALAGPTGFAATPNGGEFTFTRKKVDGTGNETVTEKIDGTTDELGAGEIFGQILNEKGATLPSTGGIGTTIFYVGGSILVLAAAILLITKRRMSNND